MIAKAWILCPLFFLLSSVKCDDVSPINADFSTIIKHIEELATIISKAVGDRDDASDILLKMLDSSTKIPSGLIDGNFFDLGNFDECYNIQSGDIYGKYCLGTLAVTETTQKLIGRNITKPKTMMIHPQPRLLQMGDEFLGYHWAICVPSTVKAKDIPGLIDSMTYNEDLCYSKDTEPELSTGAIVTTVVLAIFLLIIVTSTVFDIVLYYTKSKNPHELLVAFSFLSNGRKVFASTTNPDQLLCLNGLKAISMMWVILSHNYSNALNAPISNLLNVNEWVTSTVNMLVKGATVSVDTFFVVGGLVTVYTFLKATDKGVKFNVLLYYLHRYLRLTPALGIMALVYTNLLPYFGNGPIWKAVDSTLVETCKEAWWSTLLYITNYVQRGDCLPQTWYLGVDMQLFVLSPIVLIPLAKWPKYGLGALGILTVAGMIVPFAVGYIDNLGSMFSLDNNEKYMSLYYYQTYTRFGPYVIGMILGYMIYQFKKSGQKLFSHPLIIIGLWMVSLTGLVACVYAGYNLTLPETEDRWGNSLFLAFDRPAWAVCLSCLIYLCVTGNGGPVDGFLSLPIFQFLTKISYSMYLVHYAVIVIRYSSMKNTFRFSNIETMMSFWGIFMYTLALSLVLCLSFESPVIIIEKHLFGRGTPRRQDKKEEV